MSEDAGLILPSGEGRHLDFLGNRLTIKVAAQQSQGALAVFEIAFPPAPAQGPPLHTHPHHEVFFVLEGEPTFQLGERLVQAPAGTLLFAPGGIAHTLTNRRPRPARVLAFISPGGYERLFEEVSALQRSGPLSPEQFREVAGRYGQRVLGPPLPPEV
jgi:quercetin dioxygenase-like cupin family protein